MNDQSDSRMAQLVDGNAAKFIRTVIVPALITAVLWLAGAIFSTVTANGERQAEATRELRDSMSELKQSVAVQAAIFGDKSKQIDQNIESINTLRGSVSGHEARIEVLESGKGYRRP